MKKYVLIAGVNGSGKSTLYHSRLPLQEMPRVNSDEILRNLGDWRKPADVMKASRIAVERIAEYLDKGLTFNQETTLCGRAIVRNIKRAKEYGYEVELYYVGVDSVEIAKERVKNRVAEGGHGIPEKDIERRYVETFKNLREVLPYCNKATFYDNTEKFRRFAIYENGKFLRIAEKAPEWFKKYVMSEIKI